MSVTEWQHYESFINDYVAAALGLALVCFFLLIFTLLYLKDRGKKTLISSILILGIGAVGFYVWQGHQRAETYLELVKHQTPAIRDRKKKTFGYTYYGETAAKKFDVAQLDQLPFYEKEAVVDRESVTYYGKTEHIYYLRIYNTLYNVNLKAEEIEFSAQVSQPQREGFIYRLSDPSFSQLGFRTEIGPIYTKIIFPQEMEDKEYQNLDERSEQLKF